MDFAWQSSLARWRFRLGARLIRRILRRCALLFLQSRFRASWYRTTDSGRFYAEWVENAVHCTFDDVCLITLNVQGAARLGDTVPDAGGSGSHRSFSCIVGHQEFCGHVVNGAGKNWC
ncbi:MAG: hypothetical protein ACSLEN_02785 [Candidatus Malihini olakiniferum]